MQREVGLKKINLCFCTKPRLKALGLEEQVVFPHLGGPGAEGSAREMLGAQRPFSPATDFQVVSGNYHKACTWRWFYISVQRR